MGKCLFFYVKKMKKWFEYVIIIIIHIAFQLRLIVFFAELVSV